MNEVQKLATMAKDEIASTHLAQLLALGQVADYFNTYGVADGVEMLADQVEDQYVRWEIAANRLYQAIDEVVDREGVEGPCCEDCSLPYDKFGLDVTLSDREWLMVHPEGSEGLLCGACIIRRANRLANVMAIRLTLDYLPCCIQGCEEPAIYGGKVLGTSGLVCQQHKNQVREPELLEGRAD